MQELGKGIIVIGIVTVLIGVFVFYSGKFPSIGKMPGDISIKKESFSFYFPLGTSILLSIVISLVLYLLRKF